MNYALLVDPPSIEDSARRMAEHRCLTAREQVKARARIMRAEMGLPELEALQ
jgi:hypothetical protein